MSSDSNGGIVRQCIGFGKFEDKCPNRAEPNPYWCPSCDKLRIEHLDARFKQIEEEFARGT